MRRTAMPECKHCKAQMKFPVQVVLNKSYGGFGLSGRVIGVIKLRQSVSAKGGPWEDAGDHANVSALLKAIEKEVGLHSVQLRSNSILISAIRAVGLDQSGDEYSDLAIVEIPSSVARNCYIKEHDGFETLHENHFSI